MPDTLIKTITTATTAVDKESIWQFTPKGLAIRLVDAANVMMLDLFLPASDFVHYMLDAPIQIGMDTADLNDDLSALAKGAMFTMKYEAPKLAISVDTARFTKTAIEISTMRAPPRMPSLELSTEFTVSMNQLNSAFKVATKKGDHMRFICDDGAIMVESEDPSNKFEMELTEDLEIISGEPAVALYSLDYLKDIATAMGKNTVNVRFATDFPIIIESALGNDGKMTTLLAPRIENRGDDDD